MDNLEQLTSLSAKVGPIFQESNNPDIRSAHTLLHARLAEPKSFVSVIGETSSGKSTLINGLLKYDILPAGARPTTGTVTQLQFSEIESPEYYAINRDATIESLAYEDFVHLSKQPDKELLRLYIEVPSPDGNHTGINLFDTPGFNSLVSEHEEVLRQFIPQSDVIIYVAGYRTGFGSQDRSLMELVSEICEEDLELPVLLTINRCPSEVTPSNSRILEIVKNASDSLHRSIEFFIVHSEIPGERQKKCHPRAEKMWRQAIQYATGAERQKMIATKIKAFLSNLIEEMKLELENRLTAAELDPREISELRKEQEFFRNLLKDSCGIVDKYIDRLGRNLPKLIKTRTEELIAYVEEEINDSDKWTESYSCGAFVSGHAIPFGVRKIVREVENYIEQSFEQMDEELSEMANKAVRHINDRACQVQSPELSKLLGNLAVRIGGQLTKNTAQSLVSGLGGVGGIAGGTGNLVKMIVSRTGKLFGKTFKRELYTNIGKFFTKKMMQRLNIALTVILEVSTIVLEANRWQKRLTEEVKKNLENWREEACSEFENEALPKYSESNKKLLSEIYEGFNAELERNIQDVVNKIDSDQIAQIKAYMIRLNEYKNEMEVM